MHQHRFIDLFAGLGGFHLALGSLRNECVFACESDSYLAELYDRNFRIKPHGDIRKIHIPDVPSHDILCAGFPCQPFSKAGNQEGLKCPESGNLIDYVIRILDYHRPEYFILENVPNLVRHRNGKTWRKIIDRLSAIGYSTKFATFSPHQFGVPQIRERTFIVGRSRSLSDFIWPIVSTAESLSIRNILDDEPVDAKPLPPAFISYLEAWQDFLDLYPSNVELPSFPIWAMEFGATYPYADRSPYGIGLSNVHSYRGSFGEPLLNLSEHDVRVALPAYAREICHSFPKWKIDFIRQNRTLYNQHKGWIDKWLPSIRSFAPSYQKFEWNCKGERRSLWENIIQFRASGIRVKRPVTAPSLVAMTTSQIPVIAWERRYMTVLECSRLQSMDVLTYLPETKTVAFRALGNAVNVDVVRAIAKELLCCTADSQRQAQEIEFQDQHNNARQSTAVNRQNRCYNHTEGIAT